MSETMSRIKEMAKLALLSNRISEFHEINMKNYAKVFFEDVKSATIDFDLSKDSEDARYVTYRLTIGDISLNSKLQERFKAIEAATRTIFWADLKVQVWVNDSLHFESK